MPRATEALPKEEADSQDNADATELTSEDLFGQSEYSEPYEEDAEEAQESDWEEPSFEQSRTNAGLAMREEEMNTEDGDNSDGDDQQSVPAAARLTASKVASVFYRFLTNRKTDGVDMTDGNEHHRMNT